MKNKKIIVYLIIFIMTFQLCSCKSTDQVDNSQEIKLKTEEIKTIAYQEDQENQEDDLIIQKAIDMFQDINNEQFSEFKHLISSGIIPEGLENNYNKNITDLEFYELLTTLLLAIDNIESENLNYLYSDAKNESITRHDAASILADISCSDLGITTDEIHGKDVFQGKYTMEEMEGDDSVYYGWVCGILDPISGLPIMDRNIDSYIRSNDFMTVLEALQASYRLYNYMTYTPEFIEFDLIDTLNLTDEQVSQSLSMPEATASSLPYWTGAQNQKKSYIEGNGWYDNNMYTESEIKTLSDFGFNFSRISINTQLLFNLEDTHSVNLLQLKNLDDLIQWGIKYKVHICISMFEIPGFHYTDEGFYDENSQKQLSEIYALLARRYSQVPSNVLSFNLLNEPFIDDDALYTKVMKKVINAIREEDPNRLIFVDGLMDMENTGAPSCTPVIGLVDENVAQAFHWYGPETFIYTTWNYNCYGVQSWPMPYVNGWLNEYDNQTINLVGSFQQDTEVEILFSWYGGPNTVVVSGENDTGSIEYKKTVEQHNFDEDESQGMKNGVTLSFTLEEAAQSLKISCIGNNDMKVRCVAIINPEETDQVSPYYEGFVWDKATLINKKVTPIYCTAENYNISYPSSTVQVNDDGTYVNNIETSLCFDHDWLAQQTSNIIDFSQENNVGIMIQEWGVTQMTPQNPTLAYINDYLSILKDNNISWCQTDDVWQYFNTNRWDVEYEIYDNKYLDRDMLTVLQKYQ